MPGGLLVMLDVGLGEGHVDFDAVLAERRPLGNDPVLTIEETPRTIAGSVAYASEHFARYLQG